LTDYPPGLTAPRIGSLFSGAGGLDLAVEHVFGATTAWHSEIDSAASKVLAHRWPDVPNLGDITAVDWAIVEPVDILCGGFPCQDVSSAGRRAGIKDGTRSGLWAVFANAIANLRPPVVVIENVRGLLSAAAHRPMESGPDGLGDGDTQPVLRAIGAVLGDLADLGYDARWATVSASSVGAPHRRERVFIVATPADAAGELGSAIAPSDDAAALDTARTRAGDRDSARDPAARVQVVGRSAGSKSGDGTRLELLPTPVVNDMGDGKTVEWWDEWTARMRAKTGNGNGHGNSLAIELQRVTPPDLLPTPCDHDAKDNDSPAERNRKSPQLGAINALLQTPSVADALGGHLTRSGARGDEPLLPGQAREMDGRRWGKYAPAIARWESATRSAPAPTEPNRSGNPRLAPAFSEWMLGWPFGWVTALVALGIISRNDALRIIGNGVCPQQAVAALTWLLALEVAA
jgi:site-specific DNA-cytosine methylase